MASLYTLKYGPGSLVFLTSSLNLKNPPKPFDNLKSSPSSTKFFNYLFYHFI